MPETFRDHAKRALPRPLTELARRSLVQYGVHTSNRRPLPDFLIIGTKRGNHLPVELSGRASTRPSIGPRLEHQGIALLRGELEPGPLVVPVALSHGPRPAATRAASRRAQPRRRVGPALHVPPVDA